MRRLFLIPLLACVAQAQDPAWEMRELRASGKVVLRYAISLPEGFDGRQPCPVLIALPPGAQDLEMVRAGFERYWGADLRARGWVVVSPVAPSRGGFTSGGEDLLPQLFARLRSDLSVEGNGFHLAGASNGGLGAFRAALRWPWQFRSLTVLPGHPPADEDWKLLGRLKRLPVTLLVGEGDARWRTGAERARAALTTLGARATLAILPKQGHVLDLPAGRLATYLEQRRPTKRTDAAGSIATMLDRFHAAAARADEELYFPSFTRDAVFLGTDARERWTLTQFERFARRHFKGDSAWIYVPTARNVMVAPGGKTGWFDEVLVNASYGECRGTGVVRLVDGAWRVAQYNLTVPVPNELMSDVVRRIRAFERERERKAGGGR